MQSNPLNPVIDSGQLGAADQASALAKPDYLVKELSDPKIIQALNSAEGLTEEKPSPKAQSMVPDRIWQILIGIAAHFHLLVGLNGNFKFLPESWGKAFDKFAPKLSKLVNLFNYTDKGQLSIRDNNSLDGISKFLFPAVVTWVPVDDMFLAQGLSSGTTMMASAHNPRIDNKSSFMANLKQHWQSYKEMLSEIFLGGWNGLKRLASKNDFHLMHLGGNMNFFGGLGGLIADGVHPTIKTFFSAIRNMGGVICDLAKILHGDINYMISGSLYIAAHFLDMWQTSISQEDHAKSRKISHYVQWLSTIANYFYIKPSETMANDEFKDRVKDKRQLAYAMG